MKQKRTPVIVGAFVIGAVILGVVGLLSFGGDRFFGKPIRFVVMMENISTSGLDPGSAVKLSGVRIGRVESVRASYISATNSIAIRVTCDVDENLAAEIFPADATLEDLILKGLQAKLRFAGITGLLYLDLSIDSEHRPDKVVLDPEFGTPVVPTGQDSIAEFTDALVKISTGLAEVDYRGISNELKEVLTNANAQLKEGDLAATIQSVRAAADSIRALAENENIETALASLSDTAGELNAFVSQLNEAVPGISTDLRELLSNAKEAMQGLQELAQGANTLLDSQTGLPAELAVALEKLQRAAVAIERLADYVERNPSSLIRGRAESPDEH